MTPIKRGIVSMLIGEAIVFVLTTPVVLALWLLSREHDAHVAAAVIACCGWMFGGPFVAFGPPDVYALLEAADKKAEADLAKLLEEHKP